MSECTHWWLSQPEGLCSPPRVILHEPLSGSLLAAALCVPDLCLLAGAVHPSVGSFYPGLVSVRRCCELEPSLGATLSVPIPGIMCSASPFSLRSAVRVVPTLHHSTASALGEGKSPMEKPCGCMQIESLWVRYFFGPPCADSLTQWFSACDLLTTIALCQLLLQAREMRLAQAEV